MRYVKDLFLTVALAGTIGGLISCEEQSRTGSITSLQNEPNEPMEVNLPYEQETSEAQPSDIEETVAAAELKSPPRPVADNNLRFVCHLNFKKETLTSVHAKLGIGCTRCHGVSEMHRSDEDAVIPPDVMFPKAKINPFCTGCHKEDSIDVPAHKTLRDQTDPMKACCTDCHGKHRLNYRTRKWDKITRTLIKDQRVRRLMDEIDDRN